MSKRRSWVLRLLWDLVDGEARRRIMALEQQLTDTQCNEKYFRDRAVQNGMEVELLREQLKLQAQYVRTLESQHDNRTWV